MKKMLFAIVGGLSFSIASAQTLPGYNTSNYNGVNGVFNNPANVVGSKYKWNVNLLSINAGLSNDNASYSLKNLSSTFDDDGLDSLFFGDSKKSTSALANVDIQGLSFMFDINKKNSIAFTSRVRVMANIADLDGQFIQSINDQVSPSTTFPITLQSNKNQKFIINGWTDLGVTFGHVFLDKGPHFLKAGITGKYLAGATNNYVNIDNFKGTLNEDVAGDVFLTNASGKVAIGLAGIDFSDDAEIGDAIDFKSKGIGADIGFVYEYRPGNSNQYKFKAGLSVLDIGSVKYTPNPNQSGAYTIAIPNGSRWYPSELNDKSLTEIKTYLDGSPYFTNNAVSGNSYKVSLPTTVQLNVDYAASKHFFVNLGGQINVAKNDAYSSFYYNYVAVTPRYENKIFGAYLPVSYNELSGFNAGFSLRVGPFFVGSGSIVNAALDNSKQADFFFGARFGGLRKN